tara:strand:+ start:4852 stop:5274 length:423 start_codon:yes stop_codon:yes gene_type:complete
MNEKWFFTVLCSFSILIGQSSVFESEPGYINVISDSSTVPIYLDGNLVGHTPIEDPIPVIEGVHFIGFHSTTFKDPFLSYGNIETDKQIFVLSGDTVNVSFNTFLIDKNIERVRKEYKITNYIGIGIITLFLWQLWIISS